VAQAAKKAFGIEIDGQKFEITEREMTAGEILQVVGKSADTVYLVEIRGQRERESYQGRPDTVIKVSPGSKFITVSTGPTPVS